MTNYRTLLVAVVWALCCLPYPVSAQNQHADYVVLGKSINHRQSGADDLGLLNTVFFAEIFATENGQVTNGYLHGPGEAGNGLKFPGGRIQFLAGDRQYSIDSLTEHYPDGTYHFSFDTPEGNVSKLPATFNRDQGEMRNPGPIEVFLYQGGMSANPAAINPELDLVVRWSEFAKGSSDPRGIIDDMIYVMMGDCMGVETVHSGHAISDPMALTYAAEEFIIPSDSLHAGQPFQLEVEHSNMDTDVWNDIEIIVTYAATTFLDIQTTGDDKQSRHCPDKPYAMDGGQTDRERRIRPMDEFGTTASNVFFYYENLEAATDFYSRVLGLRTAADYGYARVMQVAEKSFITLVDAQEGMHSADEPKTTAIALITDQLDDWWEYINSQDVEMRSTDYAAKEGSAHDGFVAVDPEGYFLEFERFNEHPENELFMPLLNATRTLYPAPGTSTVPAGLGFKATVVWFYYKDMDRIQRFYEDVIGLKLVVDQGWAKVYALGPTGYFGPVDEARGMHNFTDKKAVTLSLLTGDIDGWYDYLGHHDGIQMRSEEVNDTDRYRAFVAYDPEGYYLEWDTFRKVPENRVLSDAIGK